MLGISSLAPSRFCGAALRCALRSLAGALSLSSLFELLRLREVALALLAVQIPEGDATQLSLRLLVFRSRAPPPTGPPELRKILQNEARVYSLAHASSC